MRRHRGMANKDLRVKATVTHTDTHRGPWCQGGEKKGMAWSEREGQAVPLPLSHPRHATYLFIQSLWKKTGKRFQLGSVRPLLSGCLETHLWHVQRVWEHKHWLNMKQGKLQWWGEGKYGHAGAVVRDCLKLSPAIFVLEQQNKKPLCIKSLFWCSWHALRFKVIKMQMNAINGLSENNIREQKYHAAMFFFPMPFIIT